MLIICCFVKESHLLDCKRGKTGDRPARQPVRQKKIRINNYSVNYDKFGNKIQSKKCERA